MKNSKLTKLAFVLALFLMLTSLTPLSVWASDEEDAEQAQPVEWELLDDGTIRNSEGISYTEYIIPIGTFYLRETIYSYADSIEIDGVRQSIDSTSSECGIIRIGDSVYVTGECRRELNSYFDGEIAQYVLEGETSFEYVYADLTADALMLFKQSANGTQGKTLDVTELSDAEVCYVLARDKSLTFAYQVGAVFEMNGRYYYLDFEELDSRYFDSEGYFSFKRGKNVTVYELSDSACDEYEQAKEELEEIEIVYEEEYDPLATMFAKIVGLVLFFVGWVIAGLILPIPFIVFSIIMANKKPRGATRYWYTVTALAVAWIAVAAITAIVITVITFI